MPDPTSSAVPAKLPVSRWPLWLGLVCLAAGLVPFLAQGISVWQTDDDLRSIVNNFFADVSQGRKEAALAYLSDEYRSTILTGEAAAAEIPWEPSQEISFLILSVNQSSDSAEVHVSLAKNGFTLKPTVYLQREPDQSWRITRIDHIGVDPHWTRWHEQQLREAEEALAKELADKLSVELEK